MFLQSLQTVTTVEEYLQLEYTHLYRHIAGWLQKLQGWPGIKTDTDIYRHNMSVLLYIRHDHPITKPTTDKQHRINQQEYTFLSTKGCLRVIKVFPFHLVSNISLKYSERALRTHRWAVNICPWTENLTSLCWPCSINLKQKHTNDWSRWRFEVIVHSFRYCNGTILCFLVSL